MSWNYFQISENVPSGRSDDPPLLPGEKVQGVARDVTYLCPFSGPARGGLSVTNYKLYFKSLERDTQLVIEVPLGVVSILCKHSSNLLTFKYIFNLI